MLDKDLEHQDILKIREEFHWVTLLIGLEVHSFEIYFYLKQITGQHRKQMERIFL